MSGGTALNIGFDNKKKSSKGPSKDLVDRLSRKPDHTKIKAPKNDREQVFQAAKAPRDGSRMAVKVNPVTGKMTTVEKKGGQDMVREGSMFIPKEYLHAAAAAGLGNANGMYSHLSGLRRELNSGHNMAGPAKGGPKAKSTYQPTVSNVGGRIHKIDTVPKRNNIKQVVQGRSRSITNGSSGGNQVNESSYLRQKGVVNGMGGCSNTRTKPTERKTGIASLGSSGGRSFIKHDKSSATAKKPVPSVSAAAKPSSSEPVKRGPSICKKLGGTANASKASAESSQVNMSDREKRAAYFAAKFSAK